MTRDETKEILMRISSAYPNWRPQADLSFVTETWWECLSGYGLGQVKAALKAYILADTSGFAPSIGQLIEKMQTLQRPAELTEMEAWALVSRALRNGRYGAEREFEGLPPIVQKAVGAPSQLRNWSQTDNESVENVIQSNFLRTYRAVLAREREMAKMPPEIRRLIEGIAPGPRISWQAGAEGEAEGRAERREAVPMPDRCMERLRRELLGS